MPESTHTLSQNHDHSESTISAIIPIKAGQIGGNQIQTANARDLHTWLEVGKDFSNWIKLRIKHYGFIEGVDYVTSEVFAETGKNSARQNGRAGNRGLRIEYHISLDMAKELAMVERNAKGKQARLYFIECERRAQELSSQNAGMVAGFDSPAMLAMGGMMRGVVRKQVSDLVPVMLHEFIDGLLPSMVERALLAGERKVTQGVSALEVAEMAGYKSGNRHRGMTQLITAKLLPYHIKMKHFPEKSPHGASKVWIYNESLSRQWLREGGQRLIENYAAQRKGRGQGTLKLVQP